MRHYFKNLAKLLTFLLCTAILVSVIPSNAFALYGDEPEINSNCALLYETHSGEIIYSKDPDARAFPASTTKIMTALLALKYCSMDEIVTFTKEARAGLNKDSSIAGLMVGEYMPMYEMLKCLLIASGNDAANAIAIHVGGNIANFVDMMNEEAEALGCEDTHFANPHGLHKDDHYTTARDLLKITNAAREYEVFREIVSNGQVTVPPTNKCEDERVFNNTNMLLSISTEGMYLYSKATGIKTGHTTQAGYCLVSSAEDDDLEFICITLGGYVYYSDIIRGYYNTAYQDALRLYRWAFSNFRWYPLLSTDNMVTEVKVEQGQDKDHVILTPTENVYALLHKSQEPEDIYDFIVSAEPSVTAPVDRGSIHGTVTVMRGSDVYQRVNLAANSSVKGSDVIRRLDNLKIFFTGQWVNILIIVVIFVVCGYGAFLIYYNNSRNKKRRKHKRRR